MATALRVAVPADGHTYTVDVTGPAGRATVYTSRALSTPITLPDSITAGKTYWLAADGVYTVSVLLAGVAELFGQAIPVSGPQGATVTVAPSAAQYETADAAAVAGAVSNTAHVSVTGSRADGTALASLLTGLAGLGVIVDNSTA